MPATQPLQYAWMCTHCTFDARESFTRADQHEHETGHMVVLTELAVSHA